MTVLTVWIIASAILAAMANASKLAAGPRVTSATGGFRRVLAAGMLPGALVVVLLLTAAVMQARDVSAGIPSAVSPGNSAGKQWPGQAASVR